MYIEYITDIPIITSKHIQSILVADYCVFAASVNISTNYHTQSLTFLSL